jgi:DegV family protein with EDD domain
MGAVAVVTDTCHYLPRELVEQHGIRQVSLYVNWDGRQERESEMPDYDGYYRFLGLADTLPTTSQPSIGDFLAVYEPLLEQGHEIVSIHLSGGLSGTFESALQAREQLVGRGLGERIVVIDSESACGGQGMVVLSAARAANDGASLADVVRVTREARQHMSMWFAIDTLEFLRRGGRIGSASAWLGTALKIKPILTVQSEITPIERVRTSKRSFERMVEFIGEGIANGADTWVIQHIQAADVAERITARGRELTGREPGFCSEVGPVIGTHVGPGLIGVGTIPSKYFS